MSGRPGESESSSESLRLALLTPDIIVWTEQLF